MSIDPREKGKRGERQIVQALQPIVNKAFRYYGLEPPDLQRNLLQSHKGGHDVIGLDWLAIEVKYQESDNSNAWWAQCVRQARRAGSDVIPVLIYRRNNQKWKVRMPVELRAGNVVIPIESSVTFEAFLLWFEVELARRCKPV